MIEHAAALASTPKMNVTEQNDFVREKVAVLPKFIFDNMMSKNNPLCLKLFSSGQVMRYINKFALLECNQLNIES